MTKTTRPPTRANSRSARRTTDEIKKGKAKIKEIKHQYKAALKELFKTDRAYSRLRKKGASKELGYHLEELKIKALDLEDKLAKSEERLRNLIASRFISMVPRGYLATLVMTPPARREAGLFLTRLSN